ncbi:uncharacterized protein TNCV_2332341 [Trichonephila clavipes]|nr:uncharacterized protein TNCV_2332341 [Trichonephila clavipes]
MIVFFPSAVEKRNVCNGAFQPFFDETPMIKEDITNFVQSIQGFQEYNEEDLESLIACDAEDYGFQMLNDDEIVTSVQEESNPVDDETVEDEDNTTKVARVHQMLTHFLRYRQPWSSTNNNHSAVLLNYCCSRESETL